MMPDGLSPSLRVHRGTVVPLKRDGKTVGRRGHVHGMRMHSARCWAARNAGTGETPLCVPTGRCSEKI